MYFLHIADRHIGESQSVCPNALEKRHYEVFKSMIDLTWRVKQEKNLTYLPPWLECGDTFHKRDKATSQEISLLHNMAAFLDGQLDWVLIAGNHDLVSLNPPYTHLTSLGHLYRNNKLKSIKVVEFGAEVITFSHIQENFKILAIPYGQNIQENVSRFLDYYYQPGDFWVAMLHVCLNGACLDSNAFMEGETLPNDPRIGYWALGDIHKAQEITHAQPAFYAGSPIQHNFGDKLPKGVLLVNTDDPRNPELLDLNLPTFVSLQDTDQIPANAGFVRMTLSPGITAPTSPDPRIVQTIPQISNSSKELLEKIETQDMDFSPLDGLSTWLSSTNLTQEQQRVGIKLVEDILAEKVKS